MVLACLLLAATTALVVGWPEPTLARLTDAETLGGNAFTSGTWSNYAAEVVADGPLSYWRLGETSGTTAIDDQGARDGTYVTPLTLGAAGAVSGDESVTFTGGNATFGDVYDFAGSVSYTVEFWIKRTTDNEGQYRFFFDKVVDPNGSRQGWQIALAPTSSAVNYTRWNGASGGQGQTSSVALPAGSWHHVAVVWNGSRVSFYVDGAAAGGGNLATTLPDTGASLLVGGWSSCSSCTTTYRGGLDEVAIYDYALSATRIQAHYDAR